MIEMEVTMLELIKGKKTYFFAVIAALATAAKYLGYITEDQLQAIMGLTGAGAAISLRSALKDAINPVGKNE